MKKLSWGQEIQCDAWQVEIMPWTVKQHLWKSKAKKVISWAVVDQATDKKNDIKKCVTRLVVLPSSVNFKIKWQAKTTGPKYR